MYERLYANLETNYKQESITLMLIKNTFNVLLVLAASLVFSSCSPRLSRYSENQINKQNATIQQCPTFTCINEIDSTIQNKLNSRGKKIQQIYLIRHAKPNIQKKGLYNVKQARQYLQDYSSVAIQPFDSCLVSIHLNKPHTIHCSTLRRSRETARALFSNEYPVMIDSVFREFESRIINAPSFIPLPLSLWQVFSRGSWMLGFNHRGIESHHEAKQRAQKAAEKLIYIAQQEETAILVAHGMLNGAIKKALKKKGWKALQSKGQKNLGATILVNVQNSGQ
jgi:broad specificity phosphatase PhoE